MKAAELAKAAAKLVSLSLVYASWREGQSGYHPIKKLLTFKVCFRVDFATFSKIRQAKSTLKSRYIWTGSTKGEEKRTSQKSAVIVYL